MQLLSFFLFSMQFYASVAIKLQHMFWACVFIVTNSERDFLYACKKDINLSPPAPKIEVRCAELFLVLNPLFFYLKHGLAYFKTCFIWSFKSCFTIRRKYFTHSFPCLSRYVCFILYIMVLVLLNTESAGRHMHQMALFLAPLGCRYASSGTMPCSTTYIQKYPKSFACSLHNFVQLCIWTSYKLKYPTTWDGHCWMFLKHTICSFNSLEIPYYLIFVLNVGFFVLYVHLLVILSVSLEFPFGSSFLS